MEPQLIGAIKSPEVPEEGNATEVPDMPAEELLKDEKTEQPPVSLLSNDQLEVVRRADILTRHRTDLMIQSYQIRLAETKESEMPVLEVILAARNKLSETLSEIKFSFIQSFDFELLPERRHSELPSVEDTLTLTAEQETQVVGYFSMRGDIRRGLALRSDLSFDIQVYLNEHARLDLY